MFSKKSVSSTSIALCFAASLLGVIFSFSFEPYNALPLAAVSLSGFLFVLSRVNSSLQAGLVGWFFGVGHYATSLYWIGNSFYVNSEKTGYLAIPAIAIFVCSLSIFPAAASYFTVRCSSRRLISLWISFITFWSVSEWLRGHLFTGFPWNTVGYVWANFEAPIQAVSVLGIYGLGLVTVALFSAPGIAFPLGIFVWQRGLIIGLTVFGVVALWLSGEARLSGSEETTRNSEIRLRIVQPNIPQHLKWKRGERNLIIEQLVALSADKAEYDPTHIIWPETAAPLFLIEEDDFRKRLMDQLPDGAVLISGTLRRSQGKGQNIYNSLVTVAKSGEIFNYYDKVNLVPFGEYMPLREFLPFDKLTAGSVNLSAGDGAKALHLPDGPVFQPLICYEAIFPGFFTDRWPAPKWLLNVTNDAWFGRSAGPYQHYQIARVRAIERGLPLVRAANTGISAVIDPYGRIVEALPLDTVGVIDARLPKAIPGRTVYSIMGNGFFWMGIALLIFVLFIDRLLRR